MISAKEQAKKGQIIYRYILLKIQSFKWPAGTRIFSERQLEIRFASSRSLIRTILNTLLGKDLIRHTKGNAGYFVAKNAGFSFFHKTQDNKLPKWAKLSTLMKNHLREVDRDVFSSIDSGVDFGNFKGLEAKLFEDHKKNFLNLSFFGKDDVLQIFSEQNLQEQFFKDFAYNGIVVERKSSLICVDDETKNLLIYDLFYDDNNKFIVAMRSEYLNPRIKIINA